MTTIPSKGDLIAVKFSHSMTYLNGKGVKRYFDWRLARAIKVDGKGRVIKFRTVADPAHMVSDVDAIPVSVYTISSGMQHKAQALAEAIGNDYERNRFNTDDDLRKAITDGL